MKIIAIASSIFNSFRRGAARKSDTARSDLVLQEVAEFDHTPTSPGPTVRAKILDGAGNMVGQVTYGISPLADRIYVYTMAIEPKMHRSGIGTATLKNIQCRFPFPIVAVHERESAIGFWDKMIDRFADGPGVLPPISSWDLQQEKEERWQHLAERSAILNQAITQRLLRGEEWHLAVGRGLGEELAQLARGEPLQGMRVGVT